MENPSASSSSASAGRREAITTLDASTLEALLHPMFVDPIAWAAIRAVTGFCFAGLYATIESWMHDKAENVVRGRVLAIYQIVHYAGSATGQRPAACSASATRREPAFSSL